MKRITSWPIWAQLASVAAILAIVVTALQNGQALAKMFPFPTRGQMKAELVGELGGFSAKLDYLVGKITDKDIDDLSFQLTVLTDRQISIKIGLAETPLDRNLLEQQAANDAQIAKINADLVQARCLRWQMNATGETNASGCNH